MRCRRNIGKHTPAATVEANIVAAMRSSVDRRPWLMSALGAVGFPDYDFKMPQGAAIAVSRIVRGMLLRGVLVHSGGGYRLNKGN
jgi:hypothetical protein